MNTFRRLGLVICSSLFRFLLFATVSVAAVGAGLGKPVSLKAALTQTKAYERFVPSIIASNVSVKTQQPGSIPLGDAAVQKIINDAFSPKLLQTSSEQVIDSLYSWLQGQTANPNFRVDFTGTKQQLANGLSSYTFNRLSALPNCSPKAIIAEVDVYSATCRPLHLDIAAEQKKQAEAIAASQEFLPNTVLTANNLPKDATGKSLVTRFNQAPKFYKWALLAPWLLGGLTAVFGIAALLLYPTKRKGWHGLGYAVASSGVILIVSPIIFGQVIPHFMQSLHLQGSSSGGVQAIGEDIFQNLSLRVENILLNVGIQLLVAGVIVLMIERFTRSTSPFFRLQERSGLVSGIRKLSTPHTPQRARPPVQSSESSSTHRPVHKRRSKIEREIV